MLEETTKALDLVVSNQIKILEQLETESSFDSKEMNIIQRSKDLILECAPFINNI